MTYSFGIWVSSHGVKVQFCLLIHSYHSCQVLCIQNFAYCKVKQFVGTKCFFSLTTKLLHIRIEYGSLGPQYHLVWGMKICIYKMAQAIFQWTSAATTSAAPTFRLWTNYQFTKCFLLKYCCIYRTFILLMHKKLLMPCYE
jgi:hypothetical protein